MEQIAVKQNSQYKRLHPDPIVQIILNSPPNPGPALEILTNPIYAKDLKLKAILQILCAELGLVSFEEADASARAAFNVASHVDLHLIYLSLWYSLLLNSDKTPPEQFATLQSNMIALLSEDTPEEIKAMVYFYHAHSYGLLGNYKRMFELIEGLVTNIPRQSQHYDKLVTVRAMCYLGAGMGVEVLPQLEQVVLSDFDFIGIVLTKIVDSVLRGNIDQVSQYMEQVVRFPNHKYAKYMTTPIDMSCGLILLMSRIQGVTPSAEVIARAAAGSELNFIHSTSALLERKPEEALYWARSYINQDLKSRDIFSFVDHTLVRAELACRNGAAAKRLLLMFKDQGRETYLSDFFFARTELLLGNRDAAAVHFAKLKKSVEHFEAWKRLDFEIALSLELSARDLMILGGNSIISIDSAKPTLELKKQDSKNLSLIVSKSPEMFQVKETISKMANLDLPVLITGETGTGKELIANALHRLSDRGSCPFLAINCSAIPDELIESELFGYAPGAFTGARSTYRGIFRDAGDGTVFLDEIADISPRLQVALLRLLESGEVKPLGSSNYYYVKCRILAATNQALEPLVESGRFRRDLFFRLQRLQIHIPALRDRNTDVEVLVDHFLNLGRENGEKAVVSANLIEKLKQYSWSGNVRELRNFIEQLRALNSDKLYYDINDTYGGLTQPLAAFVDRHNFTKENSSRITSAQFSDVATNSERYLEHLEINTQARDVRNFIVAGHSTLRRKQRLVELFHQLGDIRVSEAAALLGVSSRTASRYLFELAQEGMIQRITPTASPKSHYYSKILDE